MAEQLEAILSQGLDALSLPYTDDTLRRFRLFYTLLSERSQQMNLTAISGEEDVARLHMLDCAAILPQVAFAGKRVLDVGSGAGFPGLVLKLLCPDLSLTLLDSTQKRVQFQQEVCAALNLTDVSCRVSVSCFVAQPLDLRFDLVVSRAVARLSILSELCMPFVAVGGSFLAMKGPAAEEEVAEGKNAIRLLGGSEPAVLHYDVPGLDASRTLVVSEKCRPTPSKYPRRFAQMKKQPL